MTKDKSSEVKDSRSSTMKDTILEGAFKLFLRTPYELVTVKDIEKITETTRGTIFYYVKNKEELFREVIEKYILTSQHICNKIDHNKLDLNVSLADFIEAFVTSIEKTISSLYKFAGITNKSDKKAIAEIDRCYLSLVMTTGYYLNDFTAKMGDILNTDKNTWAFLIQNAIAKGEVKPNTNVRLYGETFSYTYLGLALNDALREGLDTRHLRELLMHIYNQIKI